MKKIRESFHTYAIITDLFWSSAFVFTRLALRYISPFSLGFLRYLAASLALIAVLAAIRIKPPEKKDWPLFITAGLPGFALYVTAFNIGSVTVPAATGNVIISFVPVLTALLALFFYKEKLAGLQWLAIGVQFIGIVILSLYDGVFTANFGFVWLLIASVLVSVYNLLQRKLVRKYPAFVSTSYSILAGTVFLFVFAPAAVSEMQTAPFNVWLYVIFLGVFSGAVAYVCWSKAFEKAEKTSQVSNYLFVGPLLTSVLGFFIAGEIPSAATLTGGAIVILGAVMFNKGKRGLSRN
jgi:drug/metabolite transporter (DMT)-like permease